MHAKPRLTYFDFHGGRGEDSRLALSIAGVDFEDDRVKFAAWKERKSQTPFGGLPTFEVPGHGVFAQSNAVLRLIGRRHGLHPADDFTAARHDALMDAVEELRAEIGRTLAIKDPGEKKRVREELAAGAIQTWGRNVERFLGEGGPFVSGDKLHVVDLKLYVLVKWLAGGGVDHIPADVFKDFPRLTGVYEAVRDHEGVRAYYARFAAAS